jgi:drug/metabolite transporter (DMT)-like permease
MAYLALASIIWAFSFGLIGHRLQGLDPNFVAVVRLGLAGLCLLPFLKVSRIPKGSHRQLIACGALQFGLMYVCYIQAFQHLPSHLVALFSITTPLYVVLIHNLRRKKLHLHCVYAALLSVAGAAIIKAQPGSTGSIWVGFALMQVAGISFGFGQVYYRDWKRNHPEVGDHQVFALPYVGGFAVAAVASLLFSDFSSIRVAPSQILTLLYLGTIASGLGFFLWNKGAALSRPGTLAAFNNAVVPLAMLSSLFIFGEFAAIDGGSVIRLILGGTCIAVAVLIAEKTPQEG